MIIRLSQNTFAFLRQGGDNNTSQSTTYDTKSGISISANLREAFQNVPLLQSAYSQAIVLADVDTLPIPEEEFHKEDIDLIFTHTLSGHENETKQFINIPDLHTVVIFSIAKDIITILKDHFANYQIMPVCYPVWINASQQSDNIGCYRLYVYFHDGKEDIFCINKNRFKFCNTFGATYEHDALYFLLNAFTQLGFKAERDEVVLLGDTPHKKWITDNLKQYVNKVTMPELTVHTPGVVYPSPYDITLVSTKNIMP